MATEPMDIRIGDVYTLRKPHPCGSYDWRVVRVGADIGMRCLKCDRKAMLPRPEFERRVKRLLTRPDAAAGEVVENESAV
jgi:hypothetical protein